MLALGVGQFVINALLGAAFSSWLGYRVGDGRFDLVYLAIVISLSSTLIVVKLLREKFELKILSGRLTLGVLVVQDIWVKSSQGNHTTGSSSSGQSDELLPRRLRVRVPGARPVRSRLAQVDRAAAS
jgi:hypothetical protein